MVRILASRLRSRTEFQFSREWRPGTGIAAWELNIHGNEPRQRGLPLPIVEPSWLAATLGRAVVANSQPCHIVDEDGHVADAVDGHTPALERLDLEAQWSRHRA